MVSPLSAGKDESMCSSNFIARLICDRVRAPECAHAKQSRRTHARGGRLELEHEPRRSPPALPPPHAAMFSIITRPFLRRTGSTMSVLSKKEKEKDKTKKDKKEKKEKKDKLESFIENVDDPSSWLV